MTKQTHNIKCPKCGFEIDGDIQYHQIHEQVANEYNTKLVELEKQKDKLTETIEEGVKKQLQGEKSKLEKKIKAEISVETSEEIQSYQRQLQEKTEEIKKMNVLRSELAQAKRDGDELKEKLEAQAQEKINKTVGEEKEKILKQVELKFSEKDNVIATLNCQLKDMQRKIELTSQQAQGEAMELAIEEHLKTSFPLDTIEEVKKGARGADCIQIVNTRTRQNCGCIYFESKRTKEFQNSWIEKFKEDMRLKNATLGAIVTDTMPKGMEHMGQIDGVWICSYQEFKGLSYVLRETIIIYSNAIATQENRGEKMVMLYDYLCGSEFQREITAIVESFSQMSTELLSEQRSMAMIWKKRQKQIDKVLQSTIHMYGSIKGIAGNVIGTIKALELPAPVEVE